MPEAVYRDGKGTEFRIPTVEDSGRYFIQLKCGLWIALPAKIGDLILVDDLGCEQRIEQINETVYKFPEPALADFLKNNPEFQKAFHAGFESLPISKIIFDSKLLTEAAERLEIERLERGIGESFAAGDNGTEQ